MAPESHGSQSSHTTLGTGRSAKLGYKPPAPPSGHPLGHQSHPAPTPITHGPALEIFTVTWTNVKQWMGSREGCGLQIGLSRARPTTSGGESWHYVASLPSSTCSTDACGITFVNNDDGYLFNTGFDAGDGYLMTTDGGSMWVQERGRPVLSVQPFGNEVLRVSFSHSGCPGPCDISVDEAPPGSTDWHTLVSSQYGDGVQLATEGADNAYVALFLNPAGGAGSAHSTLLVTTDGGRSWSTVLDPCGTVNGDEYDMSAIGAAPGPELFALCTGRVGESSHFLEKSSDPTQGFLPRTDPANWVVRPDRCHEPDRRSRRNGTRGRVRSVLIRADGQYRWRLAMEDGRK